MHAQCLLPISLFSFGSSEGRENRPRDATQSCSSLKPLAPPLPPPPLLLEGTKEWRMAAPPVTASADNLLWPCPVEFLRNDGRSLQFKSWRRRVRVRTLYLFFLTRTHLRFLVLVILRLSFSLLPHQLHLFLHVLSLPCAYQTRRKRRKV